MQRPDSRQELPRAQLLAERAFASLERFLHIEAASGVVLLIAAALGGVVVPALMYAALNADPQRLHGWAVPTATDIAFAVGVLALLGRGIPSNVRVFLLALAIIDDIIAVLIIAPFYSGGLDYYGFLIAGLGVLIVLGFQRIGIGSAYPYVLPGAIIWIGLLMTGAHVRRRAGAGAGQASWGVADELADGAHGLEPPAARRNLGRNIPARCGQGARAGPLRIACCLAR